MEYGLYNISTETTTLLIEAEKGRGVIKSINICNCHTKDVIIRLFLDDDADQISIVENLTVPAGVTLFLDEGLSFNNAVLALKLQTEAVDVDNEVNVNVIIK